MISMGHMGQRGYATKKKFSAETPKSRRNALCCPKWRKLCRRLSFKIIQVNATKPKSTNNISLQATNPMQNQSMEAMPAQDCSLTVCT